MWNKREILWTAIVLLHNFRLDPLIQKCTPKSQVSAKRSPFSTVEERDTRKHSRLSTKTGGKQYTKMFWAMEETYPEVCWLIGVVVLNVTTGNYSPKYQVNKKSYSYLIIIQNQTMEHPKTIIPILNHPVIKYLIWMITFYYEPYSYYAEPTSDENQSNLLGFMQRVDYTTTFTNPNVQPVEFGK